MMGINKLPYKSFLGFKTVRYRIVKDNHLGFECQKWVFYYPFFVQMGFTNTHKSIERAIEYIKNDIDKVVLSS